MYAILTLYFWIDIVEGDKFVQCVNNLLTYVECGGCP